MKWKLDSIVSLAMFICLIGFDCAADSSVQPADEGANTWWKGNLHSHSVWTDGDDFPEMVADWYKSHEYHFLVVSDHNEIQRGQKWMQDNHAAFRSRQKKWESTLEGYRKRFGPDWIEERIKDDKFQIRLKPLAEYSRLFEEAGRFLLIPGEEITPIMAKVPGYMGTEEDLPQVDINAMNVVDLIAPRGGDSVLDVLRSNFQSVKEEQTRTGQPMLAFIPHPNFRYALTAEDIAALDENPLLFEVYNGGGVNNYGDEYHASTERIWDIALTLRLSGPNQGMLYGVAVDDAHYYHAFGLGKPNPGRGWVMVRSDYLTPESVVNALMKGDFYASTGVTLETVWFNVDTLSLTIKPEEGITYTTQFIGTRKGIDLQSELRMGPDGKPLRTTRCYSPQIGTTLSEVAGFSPQYTFDGTELYVRAKVISSKLKENPYAEGDFECAWTQPCRIKTGGEDQKKLDQPD